MRYAIELTPDDNDTITVTCPRLPEVTTFGEDEADARLRAVDAIETALQARIADRAEIPPSDDGGTVTVSLPALTAAKVELYRAMHERGMRKADLVRLLGVRPMQVDRILDLSHASRLDQIEAALRVLGKELEVNVRDAA